MVETKMESKDHALGVNPAGMGMRNLIATPMAMDTARGMSLAPCKVRLNIKIYSDSSKGASGQVFCYAIQLRR